MTRKVWSTGPGCYNPFTLGIDVRGWSSGVEAYCVCPFHHGDHPTMAVNVTTGEFLCFSCGATGGVNKLVMQTGGYASREPLSFIPRDSERHYDNEWRHLLAGGPAFGHSYLAKRGVTDAQVKSFDLRQHPAGIVFPLVDVFGKLCGAMIRRNEGKLRYLVYGEKPAGWPRRPRVHNVAVTEGVFGVLAADRAGIPAIASLGAGVKPELGQWLSSCEVTVCFDDDFAGYLGAAKLLKIVPLARVMIPGREWDELDAVDWNNLINYGKRTRSVTQLAMLSGDVDRFYARLKSAAKKLTAY